MDFIQVADIRWETHAEGPGVRTAVWLQGCTLRCNGCCNPEMWNPDDGARWRVTDLARRAYEAETEGITILGGEPLEQAEATEALIDAYRSISEASRLNRTVWLFTGFTWEEIIASPEKHRVAERADILIAGPYRPENTPDPRKWIGSTNQTVHFMSDRHSDLKDSWPENEMEIEMQIVDGELLINGWPLPPVTSSEVVS